MKSARTSASQWAFYAEGGAGCVFAALAAKEPGRYGWAQKEAMCDPQLINTLLEEEVEREETTVVSLVFPDVRTADQLVHLMNCMATTPKMMVEVTSFGDFVCVGFRYLAHGAKSWISGFGAYDFLPITRRAPMTEIVMRVKPRPPYEFVMKEAPPDVLHLADLDMKGMPPHKLWTAWDASFRNTARLLGKAPDLTSAAKTTYCLPVSLAKGLSFHG